MTTPPVISRPKKFKDVSQYEQEDHPFAALFRHVFARHIEERKKAEKEAGPLKGKPVENLAPVTNEKPVCIIGAGVAGLYTAMIFDSLGVPFRILESSSRVGGRLHTYNFPVDGFNATHGYDYYDTGAMRFPKTPFMKRTFHLIEGVLKNPNLQLIPYIFSSDNAWLYYNGNRINVKEGNIISQDDPFHISTYLSQRLEWPFRNHARAMKEVDQQILGIIQDCGFAQDGSNLQDAMAILVHRYDKYSMRTYLQGKNFSNEAINVFETFDKSTGWYDRALVETVCEYLAFEWIKDETNPSEPISYWCIDRGSSQLPMAMVEWLPEADHPQFNSRVTDIEFASGSNQGLTVTYTLDGQQSKSETFGAVIATTTLSALSLIDLKGCGIDANYAQYSGIRSLQYGAAVKIAVRFRSNWWESQGIIGGQSFTDLPIRTIVYPSYPEGDRKSTTLIVSYCWTQDAERLGSLISQVEPTVSPLLLTLVLRDLAHVHNMTVDELRALTVDAHAVDWLHDPNTHGAYAFFGPEEFSDKIYCKLREPAANGQLQFAGEATSACHAWVAGALDSAWHTANQFLKLHNYPQETINLFYDIWGSSEYSPITPLHA